jgi:hypothetical protein
MAPSRPTERRRKMRTKRRIALVVALVAAAAALPAASLAGQPVIPDHETFVDGPNPDTWCGVVDGTITVTGKFTVRQDASGFHATSHERGVFTASATGRSLDLFDTGVDMGTAVDNGDGTTTFTERTAGLAVRFQIPNGPVLKDADGKPILGAGMIDTVVTIDNATGDIVSFSETFDGPHPLHDGVDICGPSIAYLTS